ncbi:hypothetical protein AVDCRST_MAG94-6364 [uncultured Leptolyngbya sp.]|uniref:Uncharacterized protein n=1 Tax=uncultured Leptolyngbya sp. TaxID=332963 RepID=A0A6J4P9C2_9CYAN|nr:hypothetical protein AVDCRST_MAG94-6364 [uncultured Leptolyngbya sp.]
MVSDSKLWYSECCQRQPLPATAAQFENLQGRGAPYCHVPLLKDQTAQTAVCFPTSI